MKKILSIYYKPKIGGFNKRLHMTYEALAQNGWEVHYLSLAEFPVKHENLYFHRIPILFNKKENLLFWANFYLASVFSLLYLNLRISADLLIVFGPDYSSISLPAKLFKKTKLVLFTWGDHFQSLLKAEKGLKKNVVLLIYRAFRYLGFRFSDINIFNSSSMSKKVKKNFRFKIRRSHILPSNIAIPQVKDREKALESIKREFHIGENPFLILTVGRLHPIKNLEFLLKIFSRADALLNKDNLFLFIVGDDPLTGKKEREKLESLCRALDLNNVVLTGYVKDVDIYFAAADVFIITSKTEGAPDALLEAIGYNIPCFGSDIPEIREILRDNNLLFSLDEEGIEKAASLTAKVYSDNNILTHIKSLISEERKRFSFDWKNRLCDIINQETQ